MDVAVNPKVRLTSIDEAAKIARVAPSQVEIRVRQRKRMRRVMRDDDGRKPTRRRKMGVEKSGCCSMKRQRVGRADVFVLPAPPTPNPLVVVHAEARGLLRMAERPRSQAEIRP